MGELLFGSIWKWVIVTAEGLNRGGVIAINYNFGSVVVGYFDTFDFAIGQ